MLSIICTFISFKLELMEYRISGNSGLQLPVVATGTWLTAGYDKSEREVLQLLKSAFDCGAWFIDTADVYDRGGAELSVGRFIQEVGRSQLVIGTKVFGQMSASPLSQGLSRRHVMNACDASLQRLQTDHIDLYQCHRYDDNTPLTELLETMDILVRQGKIRYWGVSQWSAVQITNAVRLCEQHRWIKPVSNQPIYNMLNRSLEHSVLKVCESEGLGVICYSPLSQGLLTGKYTRADKLPEGSRAADPVLGKSFPIKRMNEDTFAKLEQLKILSAEVGMSLTSLALAWCLRLPAITAVITGYSKYSQVQENTSAASIHLSDEIWNRVDMILDNAPIDQYTGKRIGYGIREGGY